MSALLKQYLKEELPVDVSVSNELFTMDLDDLEITLENFEYMNAAIESAANLVVTLEELTDEFTAAEEHTEVSLEKFSACVATAMRVSGIELPLDDFVPSLEEANEIAKVEGGDNKAAAGGGKIARAKELIGKAVKWIKEKLAALWERMKSFGRRIKKAAADTRDGAVKVGDNLKDAAKKKFKTDSAPKTEAKLKEFVNDVKKSGELAKKIEELIKKHAKAGTKPSDGELDKAVARHSEIADKVLAVTSLVEDGASKRTIQAAQSTHAAFKVSLDVMEIMGVSSDNIFNDLMKEIESAIKYLEGAVEQDDKFRSDLDQTRAQLNLMLELRGKMEGSVVKGLKVMQHAYNLLNGIAKAA